LGNRDKLGNPGRFLIQRCLAVKFHKENGIVATRERDFESLRPDHRIIQLRLLAPNPPFCCGGKLCGPPTLL
jgi:hypothetical protein